MKKYIVAVIFVLSILFTLGSFGFKYLKNRASVSMENSTPLLAQNMDFPEAGDNLPVSLSDIVVSHLVSKYGVSAKSISFALFQSTPEFFRSEAAIEGLDNNISVLGKKSGDAWEVIFADEGIVPCDIVDSVDFPDTVMPECRDTLNNSLKTRLTF